MIIRDNSFSTGREDPWGCETSRLPHFLDNRLTGSGEVVSPTPQLLFTPRKIPGTHFCYRLSRPQSHSAPGRIKSTEKSNYLVGNRSRDLPARSVERVYLILNHIIYVVPYALILNRVCNLPTDYIYLFYMIMRINSHYFIKYI
jgi:hypothetical protein